MTSTMYSEIRLAVTCEMIYESRAIVTQIPGSLFVVVLFGSRVITCMCMYLWYFWYLWYLCRNLTSELQLVSK